MVPVNAPVFDTPISTGSAPTGVDVPTVPGGTTSTSAADDEPTFASSGPQAMKAASVAKSTTLLKRGVLTIAIRLRHDCFRCQAPFRVSKQFGLEAERTDGRPLASAAVRLRPPRGADRDSGHSLCPPRCALDPLEALALPRNGRTNRAPGTRSASERCARPSPWHLLCLGSGAHDRRRAFVVPRHGRRDRSEAYGGSDVWSWP